MIYTYETIGEIDYTTIYKDDKGYFVRMQYKSTDEDWYSFKEYLGKNINEVATSLADLLDWNYRTWHGEGEYLMNESNKLRELIKD